MSKNKVFIESEDSKIDLEKYYEQFNFPASSTFVKQLKKSPEQLGNELGEAIFKANPDFISGYNVIKGFMNFI